MHPNSTTGKECGVLDSSDSYLGEWMSIDCQTKISGIVCAKQPSKDLSLEIIHSFSLSQIVGLTCLSKIKGKTPLV